MVLAYVLHYVDDVPATLDFYERAFGLRRRFLDPSSTYGELETGGTALGFVAHTTAEANGFAYRRPTLDDQPAGVEIGLTVPDVQQAYDRAIAAGAVALAPPVVKPWGQTACWVRDNNGAIVELCSAMPA